MNPLLMKGLRQFRPSLGDILKAILLKAELLNCCFFQPVKCFSTRIHYPSINIFIFSPAFFFSQEEKDLKLEVRATQWLEKTEAEVSPKAALAFTNPPNLICPKGRHSSFLSSNHLYTQRHSASTQTRQYRDWDCGSDVRGQSRAEDT